MANLVEKQVRDAVVAALTGLATTGSNVFPYRFYPAPDDILPMLAVYTDEEQIGEEAKISGGLIKSHELEIRIEIFVKQSQTVQDTLALVCKEVITALEADPTLGGLVKDLRNTVNTKQIDDNAEKPAVAGVMTWLAQYRTVKGAPDVSVS